MKGDDNLDFIIARESELDNAGTTKAVTNHSNVRSVDVVKRFHFFDGALYSLDK